jgi:hypothetical protein
VFTLKKINIAEVGGMPQVVESLPSKYEALSLNPAPGNNK